MSHIESVTVSGSAPYWTPNAQQSGSLVGAIPIPIYDWRATFGAPSQTSQQAWPAWVFADAAEERINSALRLEAAWTTFDLNIYWTAQTAVAGNVVWEGMHQQVAVAGSIVYSETVVQSVVAAPAQNVLKKTTLLSGISVTDDALCLVGIRRLGSNGSDTLATGATIVHVELVPNPT